MSYKPSEKKIGFLGAGQLGKMLAQEASKLDLELHFLDKSKDYPAGKVSRFLTEGDFNNYDDVLNFGRSVDVLSIEIEQVNTEALGQLQLEGVKVFPQPEIIRLIQDKGLQKQFLLTHGIPTAPFTLFDSTDSIVSMVQTGMIKFPFVQKLRKGGYDGKGVEIIRSFEDFPKLMEGPSLVEEMADIVKEISIITVRNEHGEIRNYPAVEMLFHPSANLVEYLLCPAEIPEQVLVHANRLALELTEQLSIVGLLAIEMFVLKDGHIWINEMAPRPHNSGHHTLDNGATSQFENHLRAILDLPLGPTEGEPWSIMVNLLGAENFSGPAAYEGLEDCLAIPGVHIHLYGKEETRPHRKMGHVTITDKNLASCREKANFVQQTLKVKA
ncbi:MAG: 5-(carboxyamino)imidazole ribonucleotide synthase [Saprospiraceae bacterium]|nr:5-(carboxyamino)imidazole ribonucleotide synthase [Candidatus Vicinibacter affinis]